MRQFTRRNYLKVVLGALASILLLFSLYGGELWEGGRPIQDLNDSTQAQVDTIEDETIEIEKHLHNVERWVGAGSDVTTMTAITITAGNDTWGSWVTVLGAGTTPVIAGKTKFDFNRYLVVDVDTAAIHRIQIGWGATGDIVSSNQYTEIALIPTGIGANVSACPGNILMPRVTAGVVVSARAWVSGANGDTIEVFFGLHEYDN